MATTVKLLLMVVVMMMLLLLLLLLLVIELWVMLIDELVHFQRILQLDQRY